MPRIAILVDGKTDYRTGQHFKTKHAWRLATISPKYQVWPKLVLVEQIDQTISGNWLAEANLAITAAPN